MISDPQTEEARDHVMPCLVKGSAVKVFIAHCRELYHWFFFFDARRSAIASFANSATASWMDLIKSSAEAPGSQTGEQTGGQINLLKIIS